MVVLIWQSGNLLEKENILWKDYIVKRLVLQGYLLRILKIFLKDDLYQQLYLYSYPIVTVVQRLQSHLKL